MEPVVLLAVFVLFFVFCLVSGRMEGTMLTPPMLFTGAGLVFGWLFLDRQDFSIGDPILRLLLEGTLALVLFSDAAKIVLSDLRKDFRVPLRMLLLGIPLTIILGTTIVHALPVGMALWETALLVAILMPTDAVLVQVVVTSSLVPARVRQALNVESGLNDGIALPLVLALASIASALATDEITRWLHFAALQLGIGPLAGLVVGYLGARLLDFTDERGWVSVTGSGVASLVLVGMCYLLAEAFHGNGFIAAYTGGLVFGNTLRRPCHNLFEFVETEGQLLTLGAFFVFGSLFLPGALASSTPVHWVVALLSLTLLRMLPVWVALAGLGLKPDTRLFLGWFGPRGLASMLFISLVIRDTALPNAQTVTDIVFITVFLSVFLHGISAAPLARLYGTRHLEGSSG